jgi:IS30 family transposase
MTSKQPPSPEELIKAALALPAQPSHIKAADYREIILLLLQKHISHERIAGFLREHGVSIHQSAISRYVRKHPPTEAELTRIKTLITGQSPASVPRQQSSAERTPASESRGIIGKSQRKPEEDDGIDYSFLNMEGRPFTIKDK